MAFTPATFLPVSAQANSDAPRQFIYKSSDAVATVATDDYFLGAFEVLKADDIIIQYSLGAIYEMYVTASSQTTVTVQRFASQELTASGAVLAGVNSIELNHATVIVASTIATALTHPGLFVVKDTSATGTAAHTCTLTAGTWDGTNTIVTLNALNECIAVWFDSAGNGTIIENVGSVALS